MDQVKDLQELVTLSEERLGAILGNDASASLLWSFLHSELNLSSSKTSSKLRTQNKHAK